MKIIFYTILFFSFIFTQGWHNHPELVWKTIETDNFYIHYHLETRRSAEEAAAVAEKIYFPITSFYDYKPDSKTHIIIKDVDDISNGAAYYYDNKILIWALPLDFDLRGSHRWLNNVITHEFTHIVQIGAAMKFSKRFPASFIQFLNYENESRKDVLYGFPNILFSYPIPGVSVPPWFAEGTAQFMYPGANFDYWDSHRDMIVRDRIINNNLLSFEAMNSFGKRGIGNESAYNQGFLFCSWLVKKFGINVLKNITKSLSVPTNYSINHAMKNVTGEWGHNLFSDWKNELEIKYNRDISHIIENEIKGTVLISDGTNNTHPVWSPDNKRFAYLSNKDHDGFGQTDLFYYTFLDSSLKKIAAGVRTAPTWLNDTTIVFTKRSKPNKWGSRYFDLYVVNLSNEKEKRLTFNSRLISPIYDPNLNRIFAINSYDGTSNIMISSEINLDNKITFQPLTKLDDGMHLFSLSMIKGELYVDGVFHQGRQIYKVSLDTGKLTEFISSNWDNRDPAASLEGIIYAKDKSGIMNLVINKSGEEKYITNVIGGAFMPSVSNDGKILFSLFENSSYKISILENYQLITEEKVGYSMQYIDSSYTSELILGKELQAHAYEEKMLSMSIIPKMMIDYKTIKPGFYFYSSEVLDRFSIFGGFSANRLLDMDVFLMMEYMKYKPTFYTNLFWISRHRDAVKEDPFLYPRVDGSDVDNIHIFNDLTFSLFSGDLGTRFALGKHKYKFQFSYSNYRQHIVQNVYQTWMYDSLNVIHRYGEFGFDYYRGKTFSIIYDLDLRKRDYVMNMLPGNGLQIHASLSYELNQFMDGFTVSEEHSTFGANFVPHNTFRLITEIKKHFSIDPEKKIVSSLSTSIGALSKPEIDNFFHFFGGGLPGMKGYTFYDSTLTAPNYIINTAILRIPVFLEKDYIFGQFNLQNFSLGGVFQFGGFAENKLIELVENKKFSAGLEVRLQGFSFYSYPTAISYEYHYPLGELNNRTGKYYFSLLFDY